MIVQRFPENPIITPADVLPSRPDFEVVCAFNAGVACFGDEVILLLRVAERPRTEGSIVRVPVLNCEQDIPELDILEFNREDTTVQFHDPRKIFTPDRTYLTTISHLRVARSKDGRQFQVDPHPALMPDGPGESFGLEDPRITALDGTYYITYKSVSEIGITVSMAVTRDFIRFEKRGVIFGPENMDVCIFPEKINDLYVALHRPVSANIADMNIWAATSPDLLHWGNHRFVMGVRPGSWDGGRIGASTVPVRTEAGWLEIYHGATPNDCYCLGAVLLDIEAPHRVIARSEEPVLSPEACYEISGFMPKVVFSAGALVEGDLMTVYYGAADETLAAAQLSISEILNHLQDVSSVAA